MAFDPGGAIGPVNCRIVMRDDGTTVCDTHGDVFVGPTATEDVKAHIKEQNVEWHHQQDAIDAIRRALRGGVLPASPEPPEPPARVLGVYHLHFEDGDVMDIHFSAATFEELREKMLEAKETFRQ